MELPEDIISYVKEFLPHNMISDDDDDEDDSFSIQSGTLNDDDDSYFDDSCEESSNDLASPEKTFVCDYDKIFVCLYEELEDYRMSKNSKKKNMLTLWNNLLVMRPSGDVTNIKNALEVINKDIKSLEPNIKLKIRNNEQPLPPQPIITTTTTITNNNNNNINKIPKVHNFKSEPKPNKPEKISKKKLKKQKQKEKKEKEKQDKEARKLKEKEARELREKEAKELKEKEAKILKDKEAKEIKEKEVKILKEKEARELKEKEAKVVKDKVGKNKQSGAKEESKSLNNGKKGQESKAVSQKEESVNLSHVEQLSPKSEDDSIENIESDEAAEDSYLLNEIPAFVSSAINKKKEKNSGKTINKKNVEHIEKKSAVKQTLVKENINTKIETPKTNSIPVLPSTSGGFNTLNTSKTLKRPLYKGSELQTALLFGKEAVKLLMKNKVSEAVEFLDEAISLNSNDLRHYLNRSFCYLRLGNFSLALKDAEMVIKVTKETEQIVTAKLRAGQALCGLQNFNEAEKYLEDAYSFSQADPLIYRELMRVKILQLVSMGFKERDVLKALEECPSVEDVVVMLSEQTITEDNCDNNQACSEDDFYISDDEENPSLTRLLTNLVHAQQGPIQKSNITPSSPPRVKKVITTIQPKLTLPNNVNDKAIWVGNTTPNITDIIIRKRFLKFGKIVSIYRKPNENYSFINFESSKSVIDLLSSHSYVEVEGGFKLPIKAATRTK